LARRGIEEAAGRDSGGVQRVEIITRHAECYELAAATQGEATIFGQSIHAWSRRDDLSPAAPIEIHPPDGCESGEDGLSIERERHRRNGTRAHNSNSLFADVFGTCKELLHLARPQTLFSLFVPVLELFMLI
jgi:hypothetical protein